MVEGSEGVWGGDASMRWSGPSSCPAWSTLYRAHIETVSQATAVALETHARASARGHGSSFGGVVFHAGTRGTYHADDLHVPFRSLPHFARFAPLLGADHLMVFRLPGVTDHRFLEDTSRGLGAEVGGLKQYHFVYVDQDRRFWTCAPAPEDAATPT